jgi:hypothetical protein
MVVSAGRKESRLRPVTLGNFKAEHIAVEPDRAVEVSNLQMDVTDPDFGMDGRCHVCS